MATGMNTSMARLQQHAALKTPMTRQAATAMLTACRQALLPGLTTPCRDRDHPDRESQLYTATLRLQSRHGDPETWEQLQHQVQHLLDQRPGRASDSPRQQRHPERETTPEPGDLDLDRPPGQDDQKPTGETLAHRARFYLDHPDPRVRLTPWQLAARSLDHWAHCLQAQLPPGRMANGDSLREDFVARHIRPTNPPAGPPGPAFSGTHPAPDAAQHLLVIARRLLHQAVRTLARPLATGQPPDPQALQEAYRRAEETLQHAQETLQHGVPDHAFPTASLRRQPPGWLPMLPFHLAPTDPAQHHPGLLELTTDLTDPAPLAEHAKAQLQRLQDALPPGDHRRPLAQQAAHDLRTALRALARLGAGVPGAQPGRPTPPGNTRNATWQRIGDRLLHADFLLGLLHNAGAPAGAPHPFPRTAGEEWLARRHIPGEINSPQDLLRHRTAREEYILKFGFPMVTGAAVSLIARYSPLLEIGAGSGYLAHELQRQRADVHPTDPGHPSPTYPWPPQDHWTAIEPIDAQTAVARHPGRNLLISWPDYQEDWAQQALTHFQGEHVILIGENRNGCTGTPELHDLLEDLFLETDGLRIPQFPGIHDRVTVHRRLPRKGQTNTK